MSDPNKETNSVPRPFELNLKLHTVLMTVGPSLSGKSHACRLLYQWLLNCHSTLNIQLISSDQIRKDLLGQCNVDKYDQVMMEASQQAFEELNIQLEHRMTYPIKAEIILLDTTGLSESFRDKIREICHRHHYHLDVLLFCYKQRNHYYRWATNKEHRNVISRGLSRLNKEVRATLSLRKYHRIHKLIEPLTDPLPEDPSIRRIDNSPIRANISTEMNRYFSHQLPPFSRYVVIGDIHLCLSEFKQLLIKYGFEIEDDKIRETPSTKSHRIVLVGDYLDKGPIEMTGPTVDFIYKNLAYLNKSPYDSDNGFIYVVIGNHERTAYQVLTGNWPDFKMPDPQKESLRYRYFWSIDYLKNKDHQQTRERFLTIYNESREFFRYRAPTKALFSDYQNYWPTKTTDTTDIEPLIWTSRSFIVTHAPVPSRYLGKIDKESLKQQTCGAAELKGVERPLDGNVSEQYRFVADQSVNNYPLHIFGHLAMKDIVIKNNSVFLDTGCVHGNHLTLFGFRPNGSFVIKRQAFINEADDKAQSIDRMCPLDPGTTTLGWVDWTGCRGNSKADKSQVSVDQLTPADQRRLKYVIHNRINFISGTISPARADPQHNILESLTMGLNYYQNQGITKLSVQAKYMGSRMNLYLHRDKEKSYGVSRKGYRTRPDHLDLQPIIDKMHQRLLPVFQEYNVEIMILDGELMPWQALGKGLIEKDFKATGLALETEFDFLQKKGFEQQFELLSKEMEDSSFQEDQQNLKKKELLAKWNHNKKTSYDLLIKQLKHWRPLSEHQTALAQYQRQLDIYGSEAPLDYMAFSVLKTIYIDRQEELGFRNMSQSKLFKMINPKAETDLYEYDMANCSLACIEVRKFFKNLTTSNLMEGVVIKPEFPPPDDNPNLSNLAPFIKVRNPEYLRIIYGYDYLFPERYQQMVTRKNTKRKEHVSAKEYQLGLEMLRFPLDELGDNPEYAQVVANMLFENEQEEQLDPRL